MKKLLILISFFLCCFQLFANKDFSGSADTISYSAQIKIAVGDSLNISQMVQQQIEDARIKELSRNVFGDRKNIAQDENQKSQLFGSENLLSIISNIPTDRTFILLFASLLVAVALIINRLRNRPKDSSEKLKNAINILRSESALKKENYRLNRQGKKLEKLRKKIHASRELKSFGEQDIIKAAKKLQISKGELMLAVKIKSHQMNNSYPSKIL